jgi:hypothetical protein
MKANQFDDKLNKFRALLAAEVPAINERIALNAYDMASTRVINSGVDGDGNQLGSYSENELPLFFYTGKSLNKAGEAAVEKAKKAGKGLSYKDFREANNRPTDHVTLSFSGDMWKDIGVVKQIVDANKIVTVVGAKNTKTRKSGKKTLSTDDILDGNKERYGDFLEVNAEEEKKLLNTYDVYLQQLINKVFE